MTQREQETPAVGSQVDRGVGRPVSERASDCGLTECAGRQRCIPCTQRRHPGAEITLDTVRINGMPYLRPCIKVAKVTFDGVTCVVSAHELADVIDGGEAYTVRLETMPVRDFERLGEFTGW